MDDGISGRCRWHYRCCSTKVSDMTTSLPKTPVARPNTPPNSTRSVRFIAASMFLAGVIAVSWFEAPPVPALVGVLGAGGVLLWRTRRA